LNLRIRAEEFTHLLGSQPTRARQPDTDLDCSVMMSAHFNSHRSEARAAPSTVLMVEDDTLLRCTTAELLREFGYRVIEACSSTEAIDVLPSGPHVGLLFSDVQLPDQMDGVALTSFTMQHAPDIKVILTTGGPRSTQLDTVAPMIPMLRKPYRLAELVQHIQQLLVIPPPEKRRPHYSLTKKRTELAHFGHDPKRSRTCESDTAMTLGETTHVD
jgi:CheY-like chemotaxis protein